VADRLEAGFAFVRKYHDGEYAADRLTEFLQQPRV
jgi:hypothetical protein